MKKGYLYWLLCLFILFFSSCKDEYKYDDSAPDWLGESIYDYLNDAGNYKYYIQLIEDCGRKDELQKTGSNTLFVADDEAFDRFFASENIWGVNSYESLTDAQKNQLLRYSLLKNASLIEMLSSGVNHRKGEVIRIGTYLDLAKASLVTYDNSDKLPGSSYYDSFREKGGMYIIKDDTAPMLVLFSTPYMQYNYITDEDFSFIMNGLTRGVDDAHIFDIKIKENKDGKINRDITCKNGYIHVLEEVVIPRQNMADYIRNNSKMDLFNMMLESYSAPYFSQEMTTQYKQYDPSFNDSVYIKKFFNNNSHNSTLKTPNSTTNNIPSNELLLFDPGWNQFRYSTTEAVNDMAAMFVPTDEALNDYFYNGGGKFLQERYHTWDKVPKNITSLLLNAHMKYSMVESVPSRFSGMKNESGDLMSVEKKDIKSAYLASNGLVYMVDKVYPPIDYSSVLAPTLVSEKTKIWDWGIRNCNFRLYLTSMESKYSFLIPTDNYLNDYRCPVRLNYSPKEVWKFRFDTMLDRPVATRYDAVSGDSIGVENSEAIIKDRLEDMIDYHIVVGDIESGQRYYITKGGGFIEVEGTGKNMRLWGGGNRELAAGGSDFTATVEEIYEMNNGKSYIISKQLQQPVTSLYSTLKETSEFNKFFELLEGSDSIFVKDPIFPGYDYNVKFFSAFHYTVYVPTNQAIDNAIAEGLPTWSDINNEGNDSIRQAKKRKLENFLKYHFQDNSIYIGGAYNSNASFATAAPYNVPGSNKIKFYNIKVTNNNTSIKLVDGINRSVNVLTANSLYNIMLRDYGFKCTTAGDLTKSTEIDFSSRIVVHQIDNYLLYKKNQLTE